MNNSYLSDFLKKLIEKTKQGKIDWQSLRNYKGLQDFLEEVPNAYGLYIDMGTNSVKISDSYYFKYKNGYLFLLYIWHSSGQLDGDYFMLARVNENDPLRHIDFGEEYHKPDSKEFRILADCISEYLENRISTPDALYNFMNDIVGE